MMTPINIPIPSKRKTPATASTPSNVERKKMESIQWLRGRACERCGYLPNGRG